MSCMRGARAAIMRVECICFRVSGSVTMRMMIVSRMTPMPALPVSAVEQDEQVRQRVDQDEVEELADEVHQQTP